MATVFTYAYNWSVPLPQGFGDETNPPRSMFSLDVTGPATSVEAGMTISGITADLTYITDLAESGNGNAAYKIRFVPGTSNAASTAKLVVTNLATGAALTAATNLSSVSWRLIGYGTGPMASAVD